MKKAVLFSLLLVMLFALTSCFTTVSVSSLAPAEVDLGTNQVIAVSSTEASKSKWFYKRIPVYVDNGVPVPNEIKGLVASEDSSTASAVARYASRAIYNALAEGVFQIVDPSTTDSYLKSRVDLASRGITLILESSIDSLDLDEYIEGRAYKTRDGKPYYIYSLVQSANVSFSYRLVDAVTGKTVDAYTYSGTYPLYSGKETTIGQYQDGKFTYSTYWSAPAEDLYERAIDTFTKEIRDRLVPHAVQLDFSLMDTKEKAYAEINKLVEQGYMSLAYDQFMDIYGKTKEVVAGYNAAILNYAMGNPEQAIAFAQQLYADTYNADVGKLLQKMQSSYGLEQAAKKQAGL